MAAAWPRAELASVFGASARATRCAERITTALAVHHHGSHRNPALKVPACYCCFFHSHRPRAARLWLFFFSLPLLLLLRGQAGRRRRLALAAFATAFCATRFARDARPPRSPPASAAPGSSTSAASACALTSTERSPVVVAAMRGVGTPQRGSSAAAWTGCKPSRCASDKRCGDGLLDISYVSRLTVM